MCVSHSILRPGLYWLVWLWTLEAWLGFLGIPGAPGVLNGSQGDLAGALALLEEDPGSWGSERAGWGSERPGWGP